MKARAKFAFGGSGDVEITADEATMTLTSNYTSGPFKGVQVVKVVGNAIEARWDVNFTGSSSSPRAGLEGTSGAGRSTPSRGSAPRKRPARRSLSLSNRPGLFSQA